MVKPPYLNPLLHPQIIKFIETHEADDVQALILSRPDIHGVPTKLVAEQIVARRKAKAKLPELYRHHNIIFPPTVNLEQCSSELTAIFKSTVVSGNSLVDLTGGFGVDSYYFSKRFKSVTYVEPDKALLDIARHNHQTLAALNIQHLCQSAEEFIRTANQPYDVCYIDPSRRSLNNKKVFRFSDCEPDVSALLSEILHHFTTVLVKASPLLDILHGLRELQSVKKVFVVSVENECKELLFLISKSDYVSTSVEAIDILKDRSVQSFEFELAEEASAEVIFSDPLNYLYEPHASLLKAGAFRLLSARFPVRKLALNTHFYTSEQIVANFPGKIFKVKALTKADRKQVKTYYPKGKANVTVRNYPLTPDQLKKKFNLTDGGDDFLIGLSGVSKKFLVVAQRIK